jgi:hypothetical protein
MPYDKFLIAPLKSGLQNNVKAWLISTEAFSVLKNLYTWRGTVKKRFGGRYMNTGKDEPQDQLFSRLRVNVDTTDAFGDVAGTVPGAIFEIGQAFSIGDEVFTVYQTGNPADMLDTGVAAVNTYDTTTGAFVINGAAATTAVYFYPSTPVMSFGTYELLGNNSSVLFAFDQQFAYNFVYSTGWGRVQGSVPGVADEWSGNNNDFFNTANFRGTADNSFLMFITNNVIADGFRYWDGTDFVQLGTVGTTPINVGGDFIVTCKIIVPFKGRLVLLNVTENIGAADNTFQNRIRYSQQGSPIETDSWRQDIPGKGSFIDAPILDSIISAQFLKDRLIVFFNYSTWELVYTGNEIAPFVLQKINTELGVESLNSAIPFDKVVLGFGPNGIHQCNGVNVDRIDDLIPQEIFEVSNASDGPSRVAGIRDYYIEMAYWSFNSTSETTGNNNIYPNVVLVYDYKNGTWAYNQDSITAFGSFFLQQTISWEEAEIAWESMQEYWADPSLIENFKSVIAGNQEGYTFIVEDESSINQSVLQITNIAVAGAVVTITSINHNLADLSYVYFNSIQSDGGNLADDDVLNDRIFQVSTISDDTFTVNVEALVITGNYTGGGLIRRVSELSLLSKQYNFYNNSGTNTAVNRIDFLVDNTDEGEVTINWSVSTSELDFIESSQVSQSLIGRSVLSTKPYDLLPLEKTQERFWHSVYFNASGENFQFILGFNEEQILDPNIAFADFQLNAFIIYAMRTNSFGSQ